MMAKTVSRASATSPFAGVKVLDRVRQEGPFELYDGELRGRGLAIRRIGPDLRSSPAIRSALARSTAAAQKLAHENVVLCHGMHAVDGIESQISERPPQLGLPRLFDKRIDPRLATWIARQLAEAIVHAGSLGAAHNNLTPEHVYAGHDGAVRIDFGVMRADDPDTEQTAIGGLGDRAYEPIFIADGRAHPPPDIHAIAAIWFELLTGRRFFDVLRDRRGVHPDLRTLDPLLPAALDATIRRALDGQAQEPFLEPKTFAAALARAFYVDLDADDDRHGARALSELIARVAGGGRRIDPAAFGDVDQHPTRGAFTRMLEERERPVEPKPLSADDRDSELSDLGGPSSWAPGLSISGEQSMFPSPALLAEAIPAPPMSTPVVSSISRPVAPPTGRRAGLVWFLFGFLAVFGAIQLVRLIF